MNEQLSNRLSFSKMYGLGNDFVVVDASQLPFVMDNETISQLGNRKTGIGFDQLLVVEPSTQVDVDFNYRIFNADGSEVEHCGNGARCFAKFAYDKGLTDKKTLRVKVKKGIISTVYRSDDDIEVDMGKPIIAPADVPFAVNGQQTSTKDSYQLQYQLAMGGQMIPAAVLSMGNPHVIFLVSNLHQLDIVELSTAIQQSAYFPESVNVNFAEILDSHTVTLRTYERGVGETEACGTGACASVFAAHALDAVLPEVTVKMRGGDLNIAIKAGYVFMSGSARHVYDGVVALPTDLLAKV